MNLSKFCFVFGLVSIPLSVALWFLAPNLSGASLDQIQDVALRSALASAHSERWGIFVGLWPATLLILSRILSEKGK
jgi:hypothetical protein